jgi:hypothetical protein
MGNGVDGKSCNIYYSDDLSVQFRLLAARQQQWDFMAYNLPMYNMVWWLCTAQQ